MSASVKDLKLEDAEKPEYSSVDKVNKAPQYTAWQKVLASPPHFSSVLTLLHIRICRSTLSFAVR